MADNTTNTPQDGEEVVERKNRDIFYKFQNSKAHFNHVKVGPEETMDWCFFVAGEDSSAGMIGKCNYPAALIISYFNSAVSFDTAVLKLMDAFADDPTCTKEECEEAVRDIFACILGKPFDPDGTDLVN